MALLPRRDAAQPLRLGINLRVGDVVYVPGFDFAEVLGFGCCVDSRSARSNVGKVHIQYADGTFYHVQPSGTSRLRVIGQRSSIDIFRCPICEDVHFGTTSSCNHAACLRCWTRWMNGQLNSCHGSPTTARCWSYQCATDICDDIWDMLARVAVYVPDLPTDGVRLMVRRRRLQMNPLFPPAVQVDCRRPGCYGLGYLGSDTVMCFFCEDQWAPCRDADEAPADTQEGNLEHHAGTKKCPNCQSLIFKNGGCDHMTCRCGHEFWWTSLLPYR